MKGPLCLCLCPHHSHETEVQSLESEWVLTKTLASLTHTHTPTYSSPYFSSPKSFPLARTHLFQLNTHSYSSPSTLIPLSLFHTKDRHIHITKQTYVRKEKHAVRHTGSVLKLEKSPTERDRQKDTKKQTNTESQTDTPTWHSMFKSERVAFF